MKPLTKIIAAASMPRQNKVRAKLVPLGVDIIDRNGNTLAGITNRDAVDLVMSLSSKLGKIIHQAWLDDGKPIRGKPTTAGRYGRREDLPLAERKCQTTHPLLPAR